MDDLRIRGAIVVVLSGVMSYTVAGLLIGRDRDYLIKAEWVFIFGLLVSAGLALWAAWSERTNRYSPKRRRVYDGHVITYTSHYEHPRENQPGGWVPSAAIRRKGLHWTVMDAETTVDSMEVADLVADQIATESIRRRKAAEASR